MSTIKFTFGDLCAFFTRHPARLMVGLIQTDDEAPEHIHHPRITIRQNGVVQRVYREFDQIHGDISFKVSPRSQPHSRHTVRSAGDPRLPYDLLVDMEKHLYPEEKLGAKPGLCRARLHFSNGWFYTVDHVTGVRFADLKSNQACPHAPREAAHKMGLEVEVEDGGQARLDFSNGTEGFVFHGGRDYEVEVVNEASALQFDHFKYFYRIVSPRPKYLWIPVEGIGPGRPVPRFDSDSRCMPAAFGAAAVSLPAAKKKGKAKAKGKAKGNTKAKAKPAAKSKAAAKKGKSGTKRRR